MIKKIKNKLPFKLLILISILAIGFFSFSSINLANKSSYTIHLNGNVSNKAMEYVPNKIKLATEKKFSKDSETINSKTKLQMNLTINELDSENTAVDANGSFKIDQRSYGFKASGNLQRVVNSINNKEYLFGMLSGKNNDYSIDDFNISEDNPLNFIVLVNPNDNEEFYVSLGYGIESETGVLIFGNAEFHKEFRLYQQQLKNEVNN